MRHVLLWQDENGDWIAEVPSLPGCVSDGKTREEALENVAEAIDLYIESLQARSKPVPEFEEMPWHEFIERTAGILADDPIARPQQLPLEEREPHE